MPSDSPLNAVARQWELLTLLPSAAPGKSAAELSVDLAHAGYTVSRRTVERDLDGLQNRFPINRGEEQPFRWYWATGRMQVLGMSMTDAFALHQLHVFLEPLLPAAMRTQVKALGDLARKKLLEQRESNQLARWSSKIAAIPSGVPVIPPSIDVGVLEVVQAAILAEEKIRASYVRSNGTIATDRVLNPLGLVLSGSITYLVASAPDRPEAHSYPLHRMNKAVRSYESAVVPSGFSLQGFIEAGHMQFGVQRPIQLEAWVTRVLAAQLADTRLAPNQTLQEVEDGALIRVQINYTWRLKWWILSKTGDIEVRAPADVREEIAGILRAGAKAYSMSAKLPPENIDAPLKQSPQKIKLDGGHS